MTLTPFDSVLIANRGEIACRIIRTAKAMGLTTVAVYSDADKNAPHVKMADKAVHIGAAPVGESYLVIDKIIDAARISGAQAVHPGYGFLSENADFARACEANGIIFIGPTPEAVELMGDKAQSKRRMIHAGVPCVPGYQGADQDDAILLKHAKTIGVPVMIKASAGGGGRGMRKVTNDKDIPSAIKDARSEALNAFGSDVLILEKAIEEPKHVEIQVFADRYGNTVHMGERDCSVQRRHQKVIEEAPCPIMTPDLRAEMGAAAVKAAKDIGYVGAGTVEFMLDANGDFYFLEMNTRLQVEHPVTELITGIDLVALQIRVARGETLGLVQDDIHLCGHAIEARVYAEDPASDFLPATGPVHVFDPAKMPGVRIDGGIESGGEVSPFYDPMIAKVMAYGDTRDEARRKLIRALKHTALFGLKTNKRFLVDALSRDAFTNGDATTAFITQNFTDDDLAEPEISSRDASVAAVLQFALARDAAHNKNPNVPCDMLNWSTATQLATPFEYGDMRVEVLPVSVTVFSVTAGENTHSVTLHKHTQNRATVSVDGERIDIQFYSPARSHISLGIDGYTFDLVDGTSIVTSAADAAGAGDIIAPMHGTLLEVNVSEGDTVKKGDRLAVLEAMKMQHEIQSEIDGIVTAVNVTTGTQIAADTVMIEIKAPDGVANE